MELVRLWCQRDGQELVVGGTGGGLRDESVRGGVGMGAWARLREGPASDFGVGTPLLDRRNTDALEECLDNACDGTVTGGVVGDERRREVGCATKVLNESRCIGDRGTLNVHNHGRTTKCTIPQCRLR
jgi:hypothetical protein